VKRDPPRTGNGNGDRHPVRCLERSASTSEHEGHVHVNEDVAEHDNFYAWLLGLAAGEGLLDALRRVARVGSGELAGELGRVVADVGTGIPVIRAFDDLARRLAMPPVSRLVDQLAGSLERGTPLAEVLRAQAQDAREVAKRELLESAGRKEVGMLVPLVFLILPLTIVLTKVA
jgi:pilus assembly protein TadC